VKHRCAAAPVTENENWRLRDLRFANSAAKHNGFSDSIDGVQNTENSD
jgi:hypothetical protein